MVKITTNDGYEAEVIAAKPKGSAYLSGRLTVVHMAPHNGRQFAVHCFNPETGGFDSGHYFDTLAEAMVKFNSM